MDRRSFISSVTIALLAAPLVAGAQQTERMRRVGVLMLYVENDPEGERRATAFRQGLEKLGWTIGRNLQIDYRWGVGDNDWMRSAAAELLTRAPEVILVNGSSALRQVQQATRTVSIVFIGAADPVADGFVQSLSRPGGNITGFTVLEPSLGAKLLELLKESAPHVARVAVMFNPDSPSSPRLFESAAAAAPKFAIEVLTAPVREPKEIEAVMARLVGARPHGLIVLPDPTTNTRRKLIVELAARHRLPAIHALRAAVTEGALMSYGISIPDLFRQAAGYVDRILKGEKPADLPVQQPTKFELVINLKTAKALGLEIRRHSHQISPTVPDARPRFA
jgi:putative ABC transport system substrate-binding protein